MGATEVTCPDELMTVLKRYLRESNESEIIVASRIGVNHHTLSRWLTTSQSPTKGRLALTAASSGASDTFKRSSVVELDAILELERRVSQKSSPTPPKRSIDGSGFRYGG